MTDAGPHKIANQRAIIDRRELVAALDAILDSEDASVTASRPDILAALKAALKSGRDEIRRRFEDGADTGAKGRETVAAHCFLIDQIIRVLYDLAFERAYPLANPTSGERHAIVAVGGYGRGVLAPQSDVDLLFLLSYKLSPHTEQVIEFILYMLWDLGLKVGHATRSTDECLRMARKDHTIRTALLEARYIWGDNGIYADFRRRFRDEIQSAGAIDFIEVKLDERAGRHKRMGDSRYVLEPNVKEGKGGLRDLHTLYWIAKYLYRVDDVADLVGRGVFTRNEARRFEKAREFLTQVRCHLHYLSERPEDRLAFDLQPRVAERMGYRDRTAVRGVERFMKHYYLVAKDVGDLTRIFCSALEAEHQRKPRFKLTGPWRPKDIEGFTADGGRLSVKSASVFKDDPVTFLRLFHVAQEHDLDIHPAALRMITQNLKLIDHDLREDPEANRLFVEILSSRKDPETALRRLNEAGVLGRFVPDFGRVVAQMQHDMYHVYTVDEHTIRAIGLLHRIETGELKDDHPLSAEIIHKVQSRRALYVAVLLHDIAKGRGGDHSKLGASVAEILCPQLGLSPEETESVAWLVRHHLVMSNTAQKRDIDDPKTINDFAELMQSPERLRLLLVLTVADMRATGPHVWNGWKAALLRELYYRTEEVLQGTPAGDKIAGRVEAAKAALADKLAGWSPEEIENHLVLGYPSYWLTLDGSVHLAHAKFVRNAAKSDGKLAVDWTVDSYRDVTEVTIYTPDHAGLFSQIAGAIALSGGSIVDAKIFTMTNGWALDTFWVQDVAGDAFTGTDRLERLKSRIEKSLTGELRPWKDLEGRESLPTRAHVFAVPPRVFIDNGASRSHTVVEVNGRDRPGLLYEVTRVLTELGLQISSAKISTYGERVVDVFYVKDVFGMKVDHGTKLAQIREQLMRALREGEGAAAAAAAE